MLHDDVFVDDQLIIMMKRIMNDGVVVVVVVVVVGVGVGGGGGGGGGVDGDYDYDDPHNNDDFLELAKKARKRGQEEEIHIPPVIKQSVSISDYTYQPAMAPGLASVYQSIFPLL